MKKFLMIIALASIFALSVFADENKNQSNSFEKDESKWTTLSYVNVPIVKILEAKEGYVVVYQKNKVGTGSTVVPKSWAKGTPDNPRKLKFRNTKKNNSAYMTVVQKEGEFKRVILTIPMNKNSGMWGVVASGKQIDADKEDLSDLTL